MEEKLDVKIGDLATENHEVLRLFLRYNIDFYCRGKLSLKEVLEHSDFNIDDFLKEFNELNKLPKRKYEVKIESWPLDLLADYIQKTHHAFTDKILVEIKSAVDNYIDQSFDENGEISEFKIQIELLAKELGGHMKKEELILFPYIRKMVATRGKMEAPRFGTVQKPIDLMIHEHDTAFVLLKNIRKILNNYIVDDSKSPQLVNIVEMMNDLDHDLALHLHLENNILFSNVVELEKNKVVL